MKFAKIPPTGEDNCGNSGSMVSPRRGGNYVGDLRYGLTQRPKRVKR